jgi:hypothetical protein
MAALTPALQLAGVLVVALLIRQAVGRRRLAQIIFEADTRAGRDFDLGLLIAIVLSVVLVVLESDPRLQVRHQELFEPLELGFALLFSLEYLLRLLCCRAAPALCPQLLRDRGLPLQHPAAGGAGGQPRPLPGRDPHPAAVAGVPDPQAGALSA